MKVEVGVGVGGKDAVKVGVKVEVREGGEDAVKVGVKVEVRVGGEDAVKVGVKDAAGTSGLFESGGVVNVEDGLARSGSKVTTVDGDGRFSVKASAAMVMQQQQRTRSKGTTVAIFAVQPDFQKFVNLVMRLFDGEMTEGLCTDPGFPPKPEAI